VHDHALGRLVQGGHQLLVDDHLAHDSMNGLFLHLEQAGEARLFK
jgi:hypothetical protein